MEYHKTAVYAKLYAMSVDKRYTRDIVETVEQNAKNLSS